MSRIKDGLVAESYNEDKSRPQIQYQALYEVAMIDRLTSSTPYRKVDYQIWPIPRAPHADKGGTGVGNTNMGLPMAEVTLPAHGCFLD
jgi:hypothetical protein